MRKNHTGFDFHPLHLIIGGFLYIFARWKIASENVLEKVSFIIGKSTISIECTLTHAERKCLFVANG